MNPLTLWSSSVPHNWIKLIKQPFFRICKWLFQKFANHLCTMAVTATEIASKRLRNASNNASTATEPTSNWEMTPMPIFRLQWNVGKKISFSFLSFSQFSFTAACQAEYSTDHLTPQQCSNGQTCSTGYQCSGGFCCPTSGKISVSSIFGCCSDVVFQITFVIYATTLENSLWEATRAIVTSTPASIKHAWGKIPTLFQCIIYPMIAPFA